MIINVRKILRSIKLMIVFLIVTFCLQLGIQLLLNSIAPQKITSKMYDDVVEVDARLVSNSKLKHQLFLFWGNGE